MGRPDGFDMATVQADEDIAAMFEREEAPTLRHKLLLAIAEVHGGNREEGEAIADAVMAVINAERA